MDKLLSNHDVEKIIGKDINVLRYNELENYDSIDDLFINDCCLILYPSFNSEYNGHWTILTRNNDEITFFDPYGEFIDDQRGPINDPYLTRLVLDHMEEGGKAQYNDDQLQELKKGINTCGRWCGLWGRCHKYINIDDFCKRLLKMDNLDQLITDITNNYLN